MFKPKEDNDKDKPGQRRSVKVDLSRSNGRIKRIHSEAQATCLRKWEHRASRLPVSIYLRRTAYNPDRASRELLRCEWRVLARHTLWAASGWPEDNRTYRGAGLPNEHRSFFEAERKYRANLYLTASFRRDVGLQFALKEMGPRAIFIFHFAGPETCEHVNLTKSVVPGEEEFHFPAYSVFTVRNADFKLDPSEIHLQVAQDNMGENEILSLSPWQ